MPIKSNLPKLLKVLREIPELKNYNDKVYPGFVQVYNDIVKYISRPDRGISVSSPTYGVDRIEPDITIRGKTYRRGRPSLRLHGTTLGNEFTPIAVEDNQLGRKVTKRVKVENRAPHAEWYFGGTKPHPIPGNLVFHYGNPLPWRGRAIEGTNIRERVNHPGAKPKTKVVEYIFMQREPELVKAAQQATEDAAYGGLTKLTS